MSNWFRHTDNGALNREYLRTCAVYRCLMRYGASETWAIEKLSEYMKEFKSLQIVSCWKQTKAWRDRHPPN